MSFFNKNRKNKDFKFNKNIELYDDEIFLFLRETVDADETKGFVPSYLFDICSIRTDDVYGRCDLRVGYNEQIYHGGNIGYSVYEPFRGRRYALKACNLLLELAKFHQMKRLIITCNPENIASRRTCELFGAVYIETIELPEHSVMYKAGDRYKFIYEKSIEY